MTSILLADHHRLSRAAMVKLIDSIAGFTIVGEVSTAAAALEFVAEYTPDILLFEMAMPDISGFEVLRRIQRSHVGTRVVALTHWTRQPMPLQAMRAGIDGYLGKDISPEEFEGALYKIRFGRRYVSETISRDLARYAYGDLSDNPFQQLSVREIQIMLMVLGCKSPTAIAEVLHLSAKTVNSYRYRVFEKLGVKSDVELTLMAVQHDVIELGMRERDGREEITVLPNRKGPLATKSGDSDADTTNIQGAAGSALDQHDSAPA